MLEKTNLHISIARVVELHWVHKLAGPPPPIEIKNNNELKKSRHCTRRFLLYEFRSWDPMPMTLINGFINV